MLSNTLSGMLTALLILVSEVLSENVGNRVAMMTELPSDAGDFSVVLLKEIMPSTLLTCVHNCLTSEVCQYIAFGAATALCLLYNASAFSGSVLLPVSSSFRLYTKDGKFEHVPGNVALGKHCDQLGTSWEGVCERAIDGNSNSDYRRRSCTHTAVRDNPWSRVDLGREHLIIEITVVNREDMETERLNNFDIRVGNSLTDNGNKNEICISGVQYDPRITRTFTCVRRRVGRYVNIQIISPSAVLTLCEVIVMAW